MDVQGREGRRAQSGSPSSQHFDPASRQFPKRSRQLSGQFSDTNPVDNARSAAVKRSFRDAYTTTPAVVLFTPQGVLDPDVRNKLASFRALIAQANADAQLLRVNNQLLKVHLLQSSRGMSFSYIFRTSL